MIETARQYMAAGLTVIGVNSEKEPVYPWTQFRDGTTPLTDDHLVEMFVNRRATHIGIICGPVSGGLEVIDVDAKNDPTDTIIDKVRHAIADYYGGEHKLPAFPFVKTMNGGMHILFRTDTESFRTQDLANIPKPSDPDHSQVIVECISYPKFIMAYPSPGYEYMKPYPGTYMDIPTISEDERDELLDICRQFNEVHRKYNPLKKPRIKGRFKLDPVDAYNQADKYQDVLTRHKWTYIESKKDPKTGDDRHYWLRPGNSKAKTSGNFHDGYRLFRCFSQSAPPFDPDVLYSPFNILTVLDFDGNAHAALEHIQNEGFGTLISNQEQEAIKRVRDLKKKGVSKKEIKAKITNIYTDLDADSVDFCMNYRPPKKENDEFFWYQNKSGGLVIEPAAIMDILVNAGFKLISDKKDSETKTLIRVNKKTRIVKTYPVDMLKKYMLNYTDKLDLSETDYDKQEVRALLVRSMRRNMISEILDFLPATTYEETPFLRDTADTCYFLYKNGVVKVTKEARRLIRYDELPENSLIWESQIKQKEVQIYHIQDERDLEKDITWIYLKRICGIEKEHDGKTLEQLRDAVPDYAEKLHSFMTAAGFLLSNYKDRTQSYAVVLAEDTKTSDEGGGTGKGIFMQMISHMRNYVEVPMREITKNERFPWEEAGPDTEVLCFDDLPKYYNFEQLYNVISQGLQVRRKGKSAVSVPFENSPKIAITTNYTLDKQSDSSKRRMRWMLLDRYFNASYTPEQEFKRRLFDDYTDEEWNYFYNTMFHLVQTFLRAGGKVIQAKESINMKEKTVRLRTSDLFYEWCAANITSDNLQQWMAMKELYGQYVDDNDVDKKAYSSQKFYRDLNTYLSVFEIELDSKLSTDKATKNLKMVKWPDGMVSDDLPF